MMLVLAPMVAHDQRSHSAPFFNHLDLKNKMVPSVSCDAGTGASSNILADKSCHTLFQLPSPTEHIAAIGDDISTSHDTNIGTSGITFLKKSHFTSF